MNATEHQFRWWLDGAWQQAITWSSVDRDLWRHITSLGHSELMPCNSTIVWHFCLTFAHTHLVINNFCHIVVILIFSGILRQYTVQYMQLLPHLPQTNELPFECHMKTSSNGNIFRVTGHLCGEFTGHRWIPRTKASDAELWCFLICAWISGWVNNREAGELRRHSAHYDVTVMSQNERHGKIGCIPNMYLFHVAVWHPPVLSISPYHPRRILL